MGEKHTVRFEPVGIEIEVDEEETVLDAAFRQGVMLAHGCKEGQCASCKSFLLDGEDIEYQRYSTFALPDYEREEGYTLLCRAHVYEDLEVELINYDEDMIRAGLPIQEVTARVEANEAVTHDMRHLTLTLLEPTEVKFFPGQYVDITVPGTNGHRSFSMANTSSKNGQLEFVIKIYPDGFFSSYLANDLQVGDELTLKGPYGMFTLREGRTSDLLFIGGGAGMAPILSILRSIAERGVERKARFYYGARTQPDLCFEKELHDLEERLPDFTYIPALSEDEGNGEWNGETGLITDVVARNETDLRNIDAYICGPPPMVEAAISTLADHGADQGRIYYDKFTTTGDPEDEQ
jgi:propane monooxygenase reductase subunit